MHIREYSEGDRAALEPFFDDFYRSPALSHPLDAETTAEIFNDAVNHRHGLCGFMLSEGDTPIGFAHISSYYATEVAGLCVMIEDLYLAPEYRGKGHGHEFFDLIFKKYNTAKRFRLEATKENRAAIRLYERLGFKLISYNNMILDR